MASNRPRYLCVIGWSEYKFRGCLQLQWLAAVLCELMWPVGTPIVSSKATDSPWHRHNGRQIACRYGCAWRLWNSLDICNWPSSPVSPPHLGSLLGWLQFPVVREICSGSLRKYIRILQSKYRNALKKEYLNSRNSVMSMKSCVCLIWK